ncbi:MAG TPA: riboflavin synthase [Elusimicrobia bacterium]|nr:riboflavin synthase [Elusimicrobiota bacterium]
MFTGIVEALGTVRKAGASRLLLDLPKDWDLMLGESVAVNGVCLTMVSLEGAFDVSPETFRKTNLSRLRRGEPVNLERALKAGARLGGHFVTGHADGTALLRSFTRQAAGVALGFEVEKTPYLAEKGSVALDGISLTPFAVTPTSFKVSLIPHTLENTCLKLRRPGDKLNVEYDILAKYAAKTQGKLSLGFLQENGF